MVVQLTKSDLNHSMFNKPFVDDQCLEASRGCSEHPPWRAVFSNQSAEVWWKAEASRVHPSGKRSTSAQFSSSWTFLAGAGYPSPRSQAQLQQSSSWVARG